MKNIRRIELSMEAFQDKGSETLEPEHMLFWVESL
jgi:hypothetical protein